MKKKFKIGRTAIISILIVFVCMFTLSSCDGCGGCGSKYGQKTAYLEYSASNSSGCGGSSNAKSKEAWLYEKIENSVDSSVNTYNDHLISTNKDGLTEEEKIQIKMYGIEYTNASGETVTTVSYMYNLEVLLDTFVNENHKKAIANTDDGKKISEHFQVLLIESDIEMFKGYLVNIKEAKKESIEDIKTALNGSAGCFDTNSKKTAISALNDIANVKDVYRLGALFMIQVEERLAELEPITFKAETVGDFFANFWNNIFIFPVAWLLYILSKIFGGYYIVGLLLTTLIVRTLGWPIYAKTNDMSLKMSLMQPELQKIQEKYAGRNDPDSQRMMQMEQAQLYKKHKIGIGGCLAPFLQFPIFMAIFRAISRLPYTKVIEGSTYYGNFNWANELKSSIFGVNLFDDRTGAASGQLIGVIILVVLVVGTQILSQQLTQIRQKKNQQKQQEDIPLYRRQAYNQTQNSAQGTMKFMLWFMIIMMGSFVWTSKAGLGVYWLIGNIYSMVQMFINNATSAKRMEKLKNKQDGLIGKANNYTVFSRKTDRK